MFKKILDALRDAHIPIGIGVFAAGVFVALHGMMTGPFAAFTSTVFGFLAGHHYVENTVKDQNQNQQDK